MTNCRLGAVPNVWVKIPQFGQGPLVSSVTRSSYNVNKVFRNGPWKAGSGSTGTHCAQANILALGVLVNCMLPSDPTVATEIGGLPYTLTGKGRLICVLQSSQWLPISVPPGVIVPEPV